MKIGLIDADLSDKGTRFPNLALMKMSHYFKSQGNTVDLIAYDNIHHYNQVFISKVFDYTKVPEEIIDPSITLFNMFPDTNILYGGTGFYFDKAPSLPENIEHSKPDYSLYINHVDNSSKYKYYNNFDIGFTTRYCFRQCPFCVNRNKTKAIKHSPPEEFIDDNNKYISLLDDNFLAHYSWKNILLKLQDIGKPIEFNQGLDIRLMTKEKAKMLNSIKYYGDYFFAFDDLSDKDTIVPKIKLWNKYKSKQTEFYVLTGYKSNGTQDIIELFERIKILMKLHSLPYVMRHENYKKSKHKGLYIEIARWVNQRGMFKKRSFREFCYAEGQSRISKKRIDKFEKEHPEISHKYFNLKYENYN